MKTVNTFLFIILLVLAGCTQSGTQSDDLITVDVTKNYPKKDLILQDFVDVEYIPLETNDEFICQDLVQYIGKDYIIVRNRINDGNIFIFDRTGKALKKINRRGQGAEEYVNISGLVLDEDKKELFINVQTAGKILVYDLDGNYKRSFRHKEDVKYSRMYDFDAQNLICYDGNFSTADGWQPFMIISKQDGSLTQEIPISLTDRKIIILRLYDNEGNISFVSGPSTCFQLIPYIENWILAEPSSDTIYSYSPDHTMTPFIARTPSVYAMDPEVFLFLSALTERYYFMAAVRKEYDFETQQGFPNTDLVYDKQEKAVFEYAVYNGDFSNKARVFMKRNPVGNEIVTWESIDAPRLVEAYEKGELKGRLKEIAANLDGESNPVIVLMKHKK